ncbi:hypothetical protein KQI65_14805 [bacterium]|nr:hypothetical protein [bacterium]
MIRLQKQLKLATRYCILILFLLVSHAQAQENAAADSSTTLIYIETISGGTILGTFVAEDSSSIRVHDASLGTITIERSQIEAIEYRDASRIKDGEYWYDNPSSTRYVLGPNALPVGNGEGYYQNTYLFINTFNVGVGDYFSVGGGFEILSLSSGNPVFFFIPKVGIPVSDGMAVGAGVAIAAVPSEDVSAGIGYGLFTIGDRDDNMTLGIGYGYSGDEVMDQPIITLSGMLRTSRSFALVTENWIVPDESGSYVMLSYGIRFLSEGIAVDLGFLNNGDIAEAFALGIPYATFMVRF